MLSLNDALIEAIKSLKAEGKSTISYSKNRERLKRTEKTVTITMWKRALLIEPNFWASNGLQQNNIAWYCIFIIELLSRFSLENGPLNNFDAIMSHKRVSVANVSKKYVLLKTNNWSIYYSLIYYCMQCFVQNKTVYYEL